MTHDELIAKIEYDIEGNPYDEYMSALRAVVELHKPVETYERVICNECSATFSRLWPCPTIQDIEKNLIQ
jgi:hypothetical protein